MKVVDDGNVYEVTPHSCSCDAFREKLKTGGKCTHILKAFHKVSAPPRDESDDTELIEEMERFFRNGKPLVVAYSVYGDKIREWVKRRKLVYERVGDKHMIYLNY